MTATLNKGDIVIVDNYLRAVVLSDKPGLPDCVVGYVKGGRSVWWTVLVDRCELDPDTDPAEFADLYVDVDFTRHREGVCNVTDHAPQPKDDGPKHPPILPRESRPFRISKSEVNRRPGGRPGFAGELRRQREAAGLSQLRLAARSGYDHSYISRLEAGTRKQPTRDAVLTLADALGSSAVDRDKLLQSAGYLPLEPANTIASEPALAEAYALLSGDEVPDDVKEDVRSAVRMALRQAQRAVGGRPAA